MAGKPKVAHFVARELMREIAERGLVPGDHLAAEHELISRLGVSRGSAREGLRLLESLGVIELRRGAGGGAIISKPEPQILAAPLAMMLQFEGGSLGTVLEAVNAMEPTVAALAAERRSPEQLAQLADCVQCLKTSATDDLTFRVANRRFHDLLAEASGNALFGILMPCLSWMSMSIGWYLPPAHRQRVADEKASILEAVVRQDSSEAYERTRAMLVGAEELRSGNPEAFDAPVVWVHLSELLEAYLNAPTTS